MSESKKSILTTAMEQVEKMKTAATTEGDETSTRNKKLIKRIAIGAGAVVAGTVAVGVILKTIAKELPEVAPEDENNDN